MALDEFLNDFPTPEEFYKTYWGKKPFIVRGAIKEDIFKRLIDGDFLAGLSLEEDVQSRIVVTKNDGKKWACYHGPFEEDKFSTLGEKNWSLLVQNVEQYHIRTAELLQHFNFTPRWLMDDVMVSYSTAGGSVGPHTDSYHVFITQGIGKRKWTIGHSAVQDGACIEGLDLKVLKEPVDGSEVEVLMGDVIYIPPNFAHEGITIEEAMSFSVGFLGPKMSELLVEYGHYLEEVSVKNKRYIGEGLDTDSSGFAIAPPAQKTLQDELKDTIQSDDFSKWLSIYFSTPTHDDVENIEMQDNPLSSAELLERLQAGDVLYRPEYIKMSITTLLDGSLSLAVYGTRVETLPVQDKLIRWLSLNSIVSIKNIDELGGKEGLMPLITALYKKKVLFFT